jgi:hypothetical protein
VKSGNVLVKYRGQRLRISGERGNVRRNFAYLGWVQHRSRRSIMFLKVGKGTAESRDPYANVRRHSQHGRLDKQSRTRQDIVVTCREMSLIALIRARPGW